MLRKLIIVVIIVGGLVGLFAMRVAIIKKYSAGDNITVVRLGQPEVKDLVEVVNAPGTIMPTKKVDISAKMSARVVELPCEEGEYVKKGDLLLRLDDSDYKASLRAAEAKRNAQESQIEVAKKRLEVQESSIEGIKVSLAKAEQDLKRQKSLYETNDVSLTSYEDARTAVEKLKTDLAGAIEGYNASELELKVQEFNLEAADAEITKARDSLSYATIISPIDGIITKVNAEEGEMVMTGTMNNPGTVIMQVADMTQMEVWAEVDERDVAMVEVGQNVKVHIHAWPDKVFDGTVKKIALVHNLSNTGSRYYETRIQLDMTGERILTGLTADCDIEAKTHEGVFTVPSQSVLAREVDALPFDIRENDENVDKKKTFTSVVYKYVKGEIDGEFKVVVTPVVIGASDETSTVIKSGLTGDEQIVIGPFKVLESIQHDQIVKDEKVKQKEDEEKEAKEKKPVKDAEGEEVNSDAAEESPSDGSDSETSN